jgi:hypothetical protein
MTIGRTAIRHGFKVGALTAGRGVLITMPLGAVLDVNGVTDAGPGGWLVLALVTAIPVGVFVGWRKAI